MRLLAGTSGYAFKEWKGAFYPQELKDDAMLGYYASKFDAVEINNTFYRLPKENVLREWAAQVPESFTFSIKASQRITHHARLKEQAADTVDFLLKNTALLGDRLGPILFQLPPNLKKDLDRFRGFLGLLASRVRRDKPVVLVIPDHKRILGAALTLNRVPRLLLGAHQSQPSLQARSSAARNAASAHGSRPTAHADTRRRSRKDFIPG